MRGAVPPFPHISEWHHAQLSTREAVSELRRLVAGLSQRRPGFVPGSVFVGFVVDKVALGRFSSEFFDFSLSVSFHRGYSYSTWGIKIGQLVAAVQRHGLT
jgi:small ligand-binding sensory domain FIST